MTRTIARCIMIVAAATWIILSLCAPWVMSDKNTFLHQFVGADLLSFLGVVVTITLASAANIHFELNKLEEGSKKGSNFVLSRLRLRQSASWLISMLVFSVALITIKPWVGSTDVATSVMNGAALLIVLFNILVLVDITQMAFQITPRQNEE